MSAAVASFIKNCCVQTPPLRVNNHAAPAFVLTENPPTIAVLPSEERATEKRCSAIPTAPIPTSLAPCCVQTPPLRVNTHTAPAFVLSVNPPTIAVLPSEERATDSPCCAAPTAPVPRRFGPWAKVPARAGLSCATNAVAARSMEIHGRRAPIAWWCGGVARVEVEELESVEIIAFLRDLGDLARLLIVASHHDSLRADKIS